MRAVVNYGDEYSLGGPTTDLMNQLAGLLYAKALHGEVEPLLRRALAIDDGNLGPDHPTVGVRLNNLAKFLQTTNRLAEAEPLLRRALAIGEKSVDHPTVALRLNNLAHLLQDTNRFAEAEPLYRRALAMDEKSFGPDHPTVGTRLNNLAQLLIDTNRLAEAEALMRRACSIFVEFTRRTGHPHPRLEDAFRNYAGVLAAMGESPPEVEAACQALRQSISAPSKEA
jgi:tetratricopeptide (TPR) repeat protein